RKELALLPTIVLVTLLVHRQQFHVNGPIKYDEVVSRYKNLMYNSFDLMEYSFGGGFTPKTALLAEKSPPRGPGGPLVETVEGNAALSPQPGSNAYRIRFDVKHDSPVAVRINQLYFPGWVVTVDGLSVSSSELKRQLLSDGRMLIKLALPGE